MCTPTYFDIEYVINPWMENQLHQSHQSVAINQWEKLHNTLSQYSKVELLTPKNHLPDLVFTANAGTILKETVVPARFKCIERQPEESIYRDWFLNHGYEFKTMPEDVFFEGDGDAIKQPNSDFLWMGYGFRSDKTAIPYLKKYFDLTIIGLELSDPRFYHLDTCLCPLLNNEVMYYPKAFHKESNDAIKHAIEKNNRIILSDEDALNFAANAIVIPTEKNKAVVILNKASDPLKAELNERGYETIEINVTEFMRAGGATRCMVLKI